MSSRHTGEAPWLIAVNASHATRLPHSSLRIFLFPSLTLAPPAASAMCNFKIQQQWVYPCFARRARRAGRVNCYKRPDFCSALRFGSPPPLNIKLLLQPRDFAEVLVAATENDANTLDGPSWCLVKVVPQLFANGNGSLNIGIKGG